MANALKERFISSIPALWGAITTSVWAFISHRWNKREFFATSLANSYLGTMPSSVALHINKNFIISNKVSFIAGAITPMAGGHKI